MKIKLVLISLLLASVIVGCNQQDSTNLSSDLEQANKEVSSLKSENEKLRSELEELKFGPEKLLKEAKTNFDKKDLKALSKTLKSLEDKHPDAVELNSVKELLEKLTSTLEKEKAEAAKAETEKEAANKKRLEKATSKMRKIYDEVTENTIYTDKSTVEYINKNSFHAIISKNKDGVPTLLLRIQYSGDDWVFIDNYTFKVDDNTTVITPAFGEVKRDNGSGGVWEYYTAYVTKENKELIESIISSKKTIIRHDGDQNQFDRVVSEKEKIALQNVLDAYEALGGIDPLI